MTEDQLRSHDYRYFGAEEAVRRATERQRAEIARQLAQKNLGLSVPVLAENQNEQRTPGVISERSLNGFEAQGSTKATPCGDRMPRTPAADKPLTNVKSMESYYP